MKEDTFTIEILADGTLKTTTDRISMPNHANATQFLAEAARIAGGPVTTARKGAKIIHTHNQQQQKAGQ